MSNSVVSRFVSQLLEEDDVDLKPVMEDEGVTYLYIKHNNLYLLAVTDVNASAAMIVLYLYQVVEVGVDCCLFLFARSLFFFRKTMYNNVFV